MYFSTVLIIWLVPNSFDIDFHKPPICCITRNIWHDADDAQIIPVYTCYRKSSDYTLCQKSPPFISTLILANDHTYAWLIFAYGCRMIISFTNFRAIFRESQVSTGYKVYRLLFVRFVQLSYDFYSNSRGTDREKFIRKPCGDRTTILLLSVQLLQCTVLDISKLNNRPQPNRNRFKMFCYF